MRLQSMENRGGVVRGVTSRAKEISVYDIKNVLIRKFGCINELERKSEKYLGIKISKAKIILHCKNEKPYEGYYLKEDKKYIF